jgi:protein-tyrosine phosphatase
MTSREPHTSGPVRVAFVCLGNICRSPTAEAVFRQLVRERGLEDSFSIESRGTGDWHVGEPPDPRSAEAAAANGVTLAGVAQQLTRAESDAFDHYVCMDRDNVRGVMALGVDPQRISLLRDYDPEAESPDVPDPYYGGENGFQDVFDIVRRGCDGLLRAVMEP